MVARPPVYGGKAASYDATETLKVPGVLKVVEIDPSPAPAQFNPVGGVAVVGRNTWAAIQGRKALKVVWNDGPNGTYDSVAFRKTMEESARKPGKVVRDNGNVDTGRLRRVVETVAREAGWGRPLPKGRGLGIAAHYSFVSYVAAVVEVAVDDKGAMTIPRVDIAVDCGATVNPDRVRAQMQGATVMGLGIATTGEMTFKGGRSRATSTATRSCACRGRRGRPACTSSPATMPSPWVGWGSPACRPSRRRSATRSSRRPGSGSGSCPSAISSRPEEDR